MQGKKKPSRLTVDCANGVGAPKLAEFLKYLEEDCLEIRIVNNDTNNPKKLNFQVIFPPSAPGWWLIYYSVVRIMSRLNRSFPLVRFLHLWNVGVVLMAMQID
jgi:hypothetical protein